VTIRFKFVRSKKYRRRFDQSLKWSHAPNDSSIRVLTRQADDARSVCGQSHRFLVALILSAA